MAVPKMSQLHPGVGVNMILKADQRSGKLTTGQISEILTRGDHPRGIKVRLSNGQVGRVQSLSASSDQQAITQIMPYMQAGSDENYEQSPSHPGGRRGGNFTLQEDYRQDPTPHESTSLADYIRAPSSSKRKHPSSSSTPVKDITQAKLEKDFPDLDSALIAAILADHENVEDARGVLSLLS